MAPRPSSTDEDFHSSDVDAEGEDDYDVNEQETTKCADGGYGGDLDMDAEGKEVDEDPDDDEVVGPVKRAARRSTSQRISRRKRGGEDTESETAASDAGGGSDSDNSSSEAQNDWEGGSDAAETEEEAQVNADQNRCVFCGEDEEHDPSDEFEEYLSCAVCGDHAHKQCARTASALSSEEDTSHWRCKDCVANGLEEDEDRDDEPTTISRRRSSVPKIARDLLPQARGGIKPDSHSVFNKLILDDDPMDGSRSLRKKRKNSDDEDEPPRTATRKRRRTSTVSDADTIANVAMRSQTDGANSDNDQDDGNSASPRLRSRPRRAMKSQYGLARIVSAQTDEPRSLILAIPVSAASLDHIERNAQKKQRRRERDRERRARNNRAISLVEEEQPSHYPAIATTMYSNPFYAFPDRETDELKGKPYGGILTEAEADTSRTYPQDADREVFESARQKAEVEWRKKVEASHTEAPARPKASSGPPSKIKCINFGGFEIDTWHAAPYPEEYSRNKVLYICEFCLKYMNSDFVAWRHKLKCPAKHPPGDEIYRSTITPPGSEFPTTLSFFEVDGRRNPLYCQNLCLLAKLFLGSKTLYYDVEPFLFYVMTENDANGCHFVGYFSKEKRSLAPLPNLYPHASFEDSSSTQAQEGAAEGQESAGDPVLSNPGNNVSCILVLPVHMRRGFGKVLIEFSYLLTRVEQRTGSPEKPLSDMGLVSYRSYWRLVICKLLLRYQDIVGTSTVRLPSITTIAKETGMTPDDIISTLEALRFLVRDPITKTYALRLDFDYMREYVEKAEKKATITIDPEKLIWTPYVMGRPTNLFPLGEETTAPIQTKAPREEADVPLTQPEVGVQRALINGDTIKIDAKDVPIASISPTMRKKTPPTISSTPQPSSLPQTSPDRQRTSQTPNGIVFDRADSRGIDSSAGAATLCAISASASTTAPIPPTRFEIFPHVPGMTAKRRPGRPFGSRNGRRTSTPYRRANGSPATRPSASARRTRSKLGEVVNGVDDEDGDGENEGDGEGDGDGDGDGDDGDGENGLERMVTMETVVTDYADGYAEGDGGEDLAMEDVDAEGEEV